MISLERILRDYRDAGSVNSLLALWGFLDDHTFLTKAGDVGVVYQLAGVDYECLDHTERERVVHGFEAALRLLDDTCRVYQYLCKRRIAPMESATCVHPVAAEAIQRRIAFLNGRRADLYEVRLYLVLVHEGLRSQIKRNRGVAEICRQPQQAVREWLSSDATFRLLDTAIDRAAGQLAHKASAFEVQLADTVRPRRLKKAEAFTFFRGLVNYAPHKVSGAGLKYDSHLDYFVADSHIDCHRSHLQIDDVQVKVLSMKEPPSATFAHLLESLYTVAGEFTACLEWRRIASDKIRREIHTRRRHFFNKRVALANYVAPDTRPEEMLVDESASAMVKQLGDALTELDVNNHFFGECSLTLVLFDRDASTVERMSAEAIKVIAAHDGTFVEETYNLLNAWLSVVPGNGAHNLRRLALLETNCADLSFLFTLDGGQPTCGHLDREALAVFETRHETPYHFTLHVHDIGHALVLGATGSGKSFLLNFLVTQAQRYDPVTVIFDLGRSFRKIATVLEGSYVELGLRQGTITINPFAPEPTPEHLHFLHAFARVLLESADAYRLSGVEDRELYEAIENLYVLDRAQRRLFTLANLLPRALSRRLEKWIEGGRYGDLFDNAQDTLSVQRFQVFDFEAMRAYPALIEPLLFYVLHRVREQVDDPSLTGLKLCVMDEAWRFIQHPTLRAYVEEALKTWRKRNGAMLLATQSIEDFASTDLLRTVVESCPTKLLLANPGLDRTKYADLFQLNAAELDRLAQLAPRRQILLKRPELAKVLNLNVDAKSYWLYTNTPIDNERVAAVVREHGFEAGLDRLAVSA